MVTHQPSLKGGVSTFVLATLLITGHVVRAAHWVDTWGAMPQPTEPENLPPAQYTQPSGVLQNSTLRQTVRASIGGSYLRVRLSNAFGGTELPITAVSIALPTNGSSGISRIRGGTSKPLTFSGASSFSIPIGAQVVSDPVPYSLSPQTVLTITIYTAEGQTTNSVTSHPGRRTTSWIVRGNQLDELELIGGGEGEERVGTNHWYFLSSVEIWAADDVGSLVIVGDSITDGRGSMDNGNNRSVPS